MALKREDGRKASDLRPMQAKVGVVPNADGSAIFTFGDTIAIAAVYGPKQLHPQHMQDPSTGILRCNYDLLSFSVSDRKKPGPSRRSQELSKMTQWALEPALDLEGFPNTVIDVEVQIIQAHAGVPMRNLVCAVAIGKLDKDIVVDLDKSEEDFEGGEGPTDFPVAKLANTDQYTLLQLDGKIQPERVKEVLSFADESCAKIYEIQKKALKEALGE